MIRDLDSTLLRTFVTVVEAGSVSNAAMALHRTQAAVSMALRRLEDEVGQRLLERSPRGVKPTTAGNVLLPYAHKLLDIGLAARSALTEGDVSGTVRVGIPEDIAMSHLRHALRQFSALYPDVALEIVVDASPALSQRLASNTLDFAIGDPALIHSEPIVTWRHPLRWAAARTRNTDLGEGPLPIVAFGGACRWQEIFFATLLDAGIAWRVACTSTSLSAVQSAVEAGLGIAVLLDWHVRRDTMHAIDPQAVGLPMPPVAEFGLFTQENWNDRTSAATALQRFLFRSLQLSSAEHGIFTAEQPAMPTRGQV
ncbi:LysR family transcriptional regulator [Paraburkholderia sp. BR13439]|uniref:LysR family transcriptional regulator n=1 Tax=Paraburkholderia youngii TaxID=2782701 RepID=A0A7Y6K9S9_9BURK|nr:LysR substrate-binding domain-containing protein [Paraburkholderia youngii]NUX58878.1 LysR family transcriptional regulator [Paraburkholderia youngii]NUY06000.1 LysR family transcriptional regulator [Paraburkholderia youngii]NVH76839.1 LysR family transcriptional regulator [Paraburkholderia youngii]